MQVLTKPVDPVKLRELLAAERAAKASAEGENAMAVKFFGQFLVQEGVVTVDQLREVWSSWIAESEDFRRLRSKKVT